MSVTQREPARLTRIARGRLRDCLRTVASRICCQADGHTITLEGDVSSWYDKQLAQESVMAIDAGLTIINRLAVVKP